VTMIRSQFYIHFVVLLSCLAEKTEETTSKGYLAGMIQLQLRSIVSTYST